MTEDYQGLTPPPELVEKWRTAPEYASDREPVRMVTMTTTRVQEIADQAAQYGADQELEACCAWTAIVGGAEALRAARRPKPPSLAEEALEAMRSMQIEPCRINGITVNTELISKYDTIRRALERLQELEGTNG